MTTSKGAYLRVAERYGLIILAVLMLAVVVRSMIVLPSEEKRFQRHNAAYLEQHNARKEGLQKRFSKQERFQVIKHLWLSGKEPRLEIELKAVRSEVGVTVVKSETRLIETFYDAEGLIQEELFYKDEKGNEYTISEKGEIIPKAKVKEAVETAVEGEEKVAEVVTVPPIEELTPMQRFRYFESQKCIYDYHSNTLVASDVNFWTYVAPHHELVKTRENLWPEHSGHAASMTMCHLGTVGSLQFSSENLRMEVPTAW